MRQLGQILFRAFFGGFFTLRYLPQIEKKTVFFILLFIFVGPQKKTFFFGL